MVAKIRLFNHKQIRGVDNFAGYVDKYKRYKYLEQV